MTYLRQFDNINPLERIIASASYFTAGMAGFIWMIIAALLKKGIKPFLMFHIFQAIFISIAYFIFIELYKLLFIILVKIPLINSMFLLFNGLIFNPLPIFWGMSLMQIFTSMIILYLAITSFIGQYSYLPYVSDIIKSYTGNR